MTLTDQEIKESVKETKKKLDKVIKEKKDGEQEITYLKTLWNINIILKNDVRFAGHIGWDEVAMRMAVINGLPWDKREDENKERRYMTDRDVGNIKMYIQRDYHMNLKDIEEQVYNTAKDHGYDEIKERLENIKWDKTEHIRNLLPKYLGVDNDDYQYEVMKLTMLAFIERQYNAPAKHDCVLCINGPQGIGKSTFAKQFAFNDPRYYGILSGDLASKDSQIITASKRIIELSEMESIKKSEIESIKSFLSSDQDTFRAPYARNAEDYPRRCVFIATTNLDEYLGDVTGARRFLCVEARKEYVEDTTKIQKKEATEDFLQAWAEAFHIWKDMKDIREQDNNYLVDMANMLSIEAEKHAKQHYETDPYEGKIEVYLDALAAKYDESWNPAKRVHKDKTPRVCALEIAEKALEIHGATRFQLKDITKLMDNNFPTWLREENRQRCGDYGRQTCWELSDQKRIDLPIMSACVQKPKRTVTVTKNFHRLSRKKTLENQ